MPNEAGISLSIWYWIAYKRIGTGSAVGRRLGLTSRPDAGRHLPAPVTASHHARDVDRLHA